MNAAVESSSPRAAAAPALGFRLRASHLGLVLTVVVLLVGWVTPLEHYVTPRSGLGYALGIIGGSLMLLLLIYPLRKRVASMTWIGSARAWFRIHMVLGIVGPLCILYHANYHLGATNSNVALISMLIVAGSGFVGRYLYGRIHHGLYGRRATLGELRTEADRLKTDASGAARLLPELATRIDEAEKRIGGGILLVPRPIAALLLWRLETISVRRYVHRTLRGAASESSTVDRHRRSLASAADRYSSARLSAARRVAEFESCRQLFGLWHVLHLPLFGMLFVAGIVHVVAVNVY
jgi:hypothetical protein